jgi:CreA protein
MKQLLLSSALLLSCLTPLSALSEEIGCFTTTWKLVGSNDKICVQAFDDPKVKGVACHISQARTGGISGTLGVA